jgi:hypothetical protein
LGNAKLAFGFGEFWAGNRDFLSNHALNWCFGQRHEQAISPHDGKIVIKSNQTVSRSLIFLAGMRDTLPLIIAAAPFGLVYGALAISQGLSEWLTMSMSLFVFAGASQFIAVTLLASSTALPVILLTVFIE